LSQWLNGGESLSRSISTGAGSADIERQRKEEFRSSGIPLKKSSTQESNKSYAKKQPARRILYPSVAQGGIRKRDIRTAEKDKEPEFVEWTNPSARTGMNTTQQADDDDGSGMAWLKKRRAEREKKAKEEAELAAASAASTSTTAIANPDVHAEHEDTVGKGNVVEREPINQEDSAGSHSNKAGTPDIMVVEIQDEALSEMNEDISSEGPTSGDVTEQEEAAGVMDQDDDGKCFPILSRLYGLVILWHLLLPSRFSQRIGQ